MPKNVRSVSFPAYTQLRNAVHKALLLGQKQIEQAKVHTYYQTGKLIQEHISRHGSRSDHYGQKVLQKLSSDLGVSETLLRQVEIVVSC